MKRIIKYIASAAAVLSLAAGCQKPFKMNIPLGVDREDFYVDKVAGTQHVTVYSTSEWTFSTEQSVDWLTITKVDNGYISGLVFDYTDNDGMSRAVNVIIKAGDLTKTVYFAQKAAMTQPMYSLDKTSVSVLKEAKTLTINASTNLSIVDVAKAQLSFVFPDGQEGEWVSGNLEGTKLHLDIKENNSGADRSATVNVFVPGAYSDGAGSQMLINQAREGVEVKFLDGAQTQLDGAGANILLPYSVNFDAELYPEYNLEFSFTDENGPVQWITKGYFESSILKARAKVNRTADRSATAAIRVTNDGVVISSDSVVLTQSVSDAPITEGEGDEQIKDPEETF